jgi:CheY-like chemotaxis protein
VIAMTANAMEHDRVQCREAGMNDFVSKPFEPRELHRVLERWRRRSSTMPGVLPDLALA